MSTENIRMMLDFVQRHPDKDHVVFCQHADTRAQVVLEIEKLGYEVRDMAEPPRQAVYDGHAVRSVAWFNQVLPNAPRRALVSSRFLALADWNITRNCCVSSTYDAEYQNEYPHLILHFGGKLKCHKLPVQTEKVVYETQEQLVPDAAFADNPVGESALNGRSKCVNPIVPNEGTKLVALSEIV